MEEKFYSSKIRKTIRKSLSIIEGIIPFTQQPSKDQFCNCDIEETATDTMTDTMKADDLFSLFTADIIKEEIIFTR